MTGEGEAGEIAIPRGGLRRLEISSGRRTRTGRGAFFGAVFGAGAGALSGVVACQVSSCEGSSGAFTDTEVAVLAAALLGIGGAVVGTGIGAVVGSLTHTDRWRPIAFGRISARASTMDAPGLRFGLSFTF